jgi:hypothetical protein
MNVSELREYVGKRGVWRPLAKNPDVRVNIRVKDASFGYGRVRLLIEPTSGEGVVWIEASSVDVEGITTPARKERPDLRDKLRG